MAKNIECRCDATLTCNYCLRNAKPYFYTLDSGERSYQLPAFLCQPGTAKKESKDFPERSE